jgi:hypothetical protein
MFCCVCVAKINLPVANAGAWTEQSMSYRISDTCPRCHKPIALVTIEPHPSWDDLALYNFECAKCGPIKTKIISTRREAEQADAR